MELLLVEKLQSRNSNSNNCNSSNVDSIMASTAATAPVGSILQMTTSSTAATAAAVAAVGSILQSNHKKRKIVIENDGCNEVAVVALKEKERNKNNAAKECLIHILEYLNVKEVCQLGSCSKVLWEAHKVELIKRKERWMKGTSKSWTIDPVEYNSTKFADDCESWNIAKLGLDTDVLPSATTETQFFDTVAAWSSSGWSKFLYTREVGSLPPSALSSFKNVGAGFSRPIQLSTPGRSSTSNPSSSCVVEPTLICDIHCDDTWVWSGIHPIRKTDLARMQIEIDGIAKSITAIYPESTKTVGDATSQETIHSLDHGYRPNKYLASINPNDTRVWSFSLSIVSPSCSETLISQTEFRPRDVMNKLNDTWVPYSGLGSSPPHEEQQEQEQQDCAGDNDEQGCQSSRADLYRSLLAGDTIRCPGVDDNGRIVSYFSEVDCHFYWDRRRQQDQQGKGGAAVNNNNNKKRKSCGDDVDHHDNAIDGRLHMTLSIFLEDDLIHNMICNAPSYKPKTKT